MSLTRKNIWILGGTGFIGTELVKHLSQDPSNALHLLVHRNIPYKSLEPFNTFTGSLNDFDLTWWEKYPPDVIFHLARLGGSNTITRFIASHRGALANRKIIQYLQPLRTPPVVVYVSGSLMYGHQQDGTIANEHTPLRPVSYAKYYVRGEEPWIEAQNKQLLDIRFARPGWILGETSWFNTFYWNFYCRTGRVPLFGGGKQRMSLVHVSDCAGQIANLAQNGNNCQNINIFAGKPVTQEVFAETLALLLHSQTEAITFKELNKAYGKTVAEALTSSIPLETQYEELINLYKLKYPDVKTMLQETLSILKHHQSVLTKSP